MPARDVREVLVAERRHRARAAGEVVALARRRGDAGAVRAALRAGSATGAMPGAAATIRASWPSWPPSPTPTWTSSLPRPSARASRHCCWPWTRCRTCTTWAASSAPPRRWGRTACSCPSGAQQGSRRRCAKRPRRRRVVAGGRLDLPAALDSLAARGLTVVGLEPGGGHAVRRSRPVRRPGAGGRQRGARHLEGGRPPLHPQRTPADCAGTWPRWNAAVAGSVVLCEARRQRDAVLTAQAPQLIITRCSSIADVAQPGRATHL